MKKLLILSLLFSVFVISWCASTSTTSQTTTSTTTQTNTQPSSSETQQREPVFVNIKYRNDRVDVSWFEYANTAGSSFIRGAWYDRGEQYMVINLNGTNYHYCEFPSYVWNEFKWASSFGSHYNNFIKWNYDCRINYLPSYR